MFKGGAGKVGGGLGGVCELAARIALGANAAVRQTSHSRPAKRCIALPACDCAPPLPGFALGRDVDVEGVLQYHYFFFFFKGCKSLSTGLLLSVLKLSLKSGRAV